MQYNIYISIIKLLYFAGRTSKTVYNQDSSKIPIVNNNDYSINDPSNMELDLADLDLSRLKLSQSELEALTNLTPNLSERQQNQLLSQLPPTQARKLSRHLSLRLPKSSSQTDKDNSSLNNNEPSTSSNTSKASIHSLRNSSESQSNNNCKSNDIPTYGLLNNSTDRQFDKYLPLQKTNSLVDSNNERTKSRKQGSQRRISRFLRPDFFDTPRDESFYAKEKREREMETQQVLREIRVKRDRSLDRNHTNIANENCLNKESYNTKYVPKTLPCETLEKEINCLEKSTEKTIKSRSKIARPKSLIMGKEDNSSSTLNEEIMPKVKVSSKLPTRQNKRESKLLRPRSYPNSSFSGENEVSETLDKEKETKPEMQPESETILVNDNDQTIKKSDIPVPAEQVPNKESAIKPTETPTKFLQTLGQTFDKLRNETKTKISKKSTKESTGTKEKTTTKQSALKLLKRKTTSSGEKNKSTKVDANGTLPAGNEIPDLDITKNDKSSIQVINQDKISGEKINIEQIAEPNVSALANESKAERKSRIENVMKSLRERSITRGSLGYTESGLIKRAVSVEDVTGHLKPSRRSVSKVLDLFNKLETENTDTLRKKDDAAVASTKLKNKAPSKETAIRPKSLIISDNNKTEMESMKVAEATKTETVETNNDLCTNNINSTEVCPGKKPITLKLDFSKLKNYRNSVENSNTENKVPSFTNSHLTNNCDYSNNYKDLDPSDISSATTCLSPNFEPELAFDDWSICSDSVIHKNHLLSSTYSDVSPNFDSRSEMDHPRPSSRSSYYSGLENSDSESIVDRIKRKSYYLRFNEKKQKRKSSIVGPGAKDYYSTSVFDKSDRIRSKPTSPICGVPDNVGTIHKYRPKKSTDLSKSISSEYDATSSHIKRRESCSAFDYNRLNSNITGGPNRNYFTLDTRTPRRYGRSYSNYDSKLSTSQHDGIYGNYLTGMHSAKDILYNRDYHLSKDYVEPKSPYSRKSFMTGCNGMYHTYNPSMSYSYHGSERSHSKSSNSVSDHR